MGKTFGRNIKVALGQETNYNEYVSPVAHGIYVEPDGVDFTPDKQIIEIPTSRGVPMPNLADIGEGVKGWTGKLRFALCKEDMNWIFLNLFGAVTTALISGLYYSHTHKISNATPKSLSVLYQHDLATVANREWRLSGGMIKSLKLIFELNKPIMVEIELTGGTYLISQTVGTAPTYSVPGSGLYFYTFKNGLFTINALTTWNHVELTFAPALADGLEDSYEYGSDARKRIERAGEPAMLITGTAKRLLDEETNLIAWDQLTTISLDFKYTVAGGAMGVAEYAFNVNLDKLKLITPPKREKKGMGLFEETLSFKAFIENADTENTIIIQDTQQTPATQ